jgi:hypothetical protein
MSLESLIEKEIYIRLALDETAFICTIQYGQIHSRSKRFPVEPDRSAFADEPQMVRVRSRFWKSGDAA